MLAEIVGVVLLKIPDTWSLTHLDIKNLRNVITGSEAAFGASQVHVQMQFASQVNTLLNPAEVFLFPYQRLPHAAPVASGWRFPRSSIDVLTAQCAHACFQLACDNQVGHKSN